MTDQVQAFFAYPSDPPALAETLLSAIQRVASSREARDENFVIHPWTENTITGRRIITAILAEIDRSEVFACDLTQPNPNVSFELGYAIAKSKRLFTCIDSTRSESAKAYRKNYYSLLGMGYSSYQNHEELSDAILRDSPWKNLDQTLLAQRQQGSSLPLEKPTLLYVQSPAKTDSVLSTQNMLNATVFRESIIVDDPNEYSAQTLDWYVDKIYDSDAVLLHLLAEDHIDGVAHNLKASIVAGLAHGFGRPVLMLAHAPYKPPIDYEHLLRVHETAESCVTQASAWLSDIASNLAHRRARRPSRTMELSQLDLRSLFLGEPVAEHEADRLYDYFVETDSFYHAMDNPVTILVGRRGTGKTAILYAISAAMQRQRRNHVTVLKPVGYETHGLLRVLDAVPQHSERGFLIESLWKYLIYSEIAASVAERLKDRPAQQKHSETEREFLAYYSSHATVLDHPFSERLESAIEMLRDIGSISDAREQRLRISELLHSSLIGELRRRIGLVLSNSPTLTLLIDGLDEPWVPGEHINHLAELIAGLLGVAQDIPRDFGRSSSSVKPVETKIVVLLRSDIFSFLRRLIPEQDKLPVEKVTWRDEELLLRVLEERMLHGAPKNRSADDVWEELFPESVAASACKAFVLKAVLPRPRDLIHFVKAAVSNAVNRGHAKVLAEDLVTAKEQYSLYAFQSILKEDDPAKGNLEEILYEFAGSALYVTFEDIQAMLSGVEVAEEDVEFYVDLLCDISFLGIETTAGFKFPRDEEERATLRNVARRLSSRQDRSETFNVNPAFYEVLQIE